VSDKLYLINFIRQTVAGMFRSFCLAAGNIETVYEVYNKMKRMKNDRPLTQPCSCHQ